jgi:hypothetical protein
MCGIYDTDEVVPRYIASLRRMAEFGCGITAFEYIHKSGGLSCVTVIELIAQEKTDLGIGSCWGNWRTRPGGERCGGRGRGPAPRPGYFDGDLPVVCGQEVSGTANRGGVPAHDRGYGALASGECRCARASH